MPKGPTIEPIELSAQELQAFLDRVHTQVQAADYQLIERLVDSNKTFFQLVAQKNMSMARLRRLFFGAKTEKTDSLLPQAPSSQEDAPKKDSAADSKLKPKPKGHGRNGAKDYPGAQRVTISLPNLKSGDPCPKCPKGKVHEQSQPGVVIRIVGQPVVGAKVYEQQKFRCNLCGQIFTAPLPAEAGTQKYDPTVGSMIGVLHYDNGMPFHRLEQLQKMFGVPLPASTQYQIVEQVAQQAKPVFEELIREAAQQELIHNDDTPNKILSLLKANREQSQDGSDPSERTGIFTTGIVARAQDRDIALFFTGRQHAGENLDDLLRRRDQDLSVPIQMCDGLSRNEPKEFQTILANCIPHSRRYFVDALPNFPAECRHVLESLRTVYRNEAGSKKLGLDPEQRLRFHQAHSGPVMEQLQDWLQEQFDQKSVEPNSGLGEAISYMRKHWQPLTLFLRQPGAPLDNNIAERVLKRAIFHRKNSLFYKTLHGAWVGDLFMSLIQTCRFASVNAYDYLTALQRNAKRVREHPKLWLPWTYQQTLEAPDTS